MSQEISDVRASQISISGRMKTPILCQLKHSLVHKKVQILMNWRKHPSRFWTLSAALLLTARNQLFPCKEERIVF